MIQYRKGDEVYNGRFIEVNDRMIITPTHEILLENGYTPIDVEPSQEELLAAAKVEKIAEIEEYAESSNVNEFTFMGIKMWLDVKTRIGYSMSIRSADALGLKSIQMPVNGNIYPIELEKARKLLATVHLYADATFKVTQQHITNVKALQSVDEVKAYDNTKGYPQKLAL
jgi:hypothetical protein